MHWIGREFGVLGLAVLAARPVIYGQEVQQSWIRRCGQNWPLTVQITPGGCILKSTKNRAIRVQQWVAETNEGDLKRVLKQNGRQLSPAEQQSSMKSYADDPAAQARQHKGDRHDDGQAKQMLSMLPKAFVWTKAAGPGWQDGAAFHAQSAGFIRQTMRRAYLRQWKGR